MKLSLRGQWVVVTGASSGLGLEIARDLAQRHHANLVLVARRKERLEALEAQLEKEAGVQVVALPADLSVAAEWPRVFEEATSGRAITAVILNAGVTWFGRLVDQTPANVLQIVQTNVAGVAVLSQLFARYLVARKEPGALMLVSSMGGNFPIPFQAVYGASKAFTTSLGCALAAELWGTQVSATVFAPGGMATEMSDSTGLGAVYPKGHPGNLDPVVVARAAVDALCSGELLRLPGRVAWLVAVLLKLLPRKLALRLAHGGFVKHLPAKG